MAHFDLPLDELRAYRPDRTEPPDLDTYWQQTLAEARAAASPSVLEPVDSGLVTVDVHDLTFTGFAGQPVRGWVVVPRGIEGPLPCVVEFIGYGGGRGLPHEWLDWSAAGYVHLVMDTRGQGSSWRTGETADADTGGPAAPGFLTRGIADPADYYYRRLFCDAARAVEVARGLAARRSRPRRGGRSQPGRWRSPSRPRRSQKGSPPPSSTCRSCATSVGRPS